MKSKLALIVSLSLSSHFALAAVNINVCNTVLGALNTSQNNFEFDKFKFENRTELCREVANPSRCESEYVEAYTRSSAHLAAMQKNYRELGCEEEN